MTTPAPRQRGLDAFFAILRDKHGLNAAITRHPAGKALPTLTAADGTPEDPLPTTTPED